MIYSYRIKNVVPYNSKVTDATGYFVAEFSKDSGTTWAPVFSHPFQSLVEAKQALGKIVANETNFQKKVLAGKFVPSVTLTSYTG